MPSRCGASIVLLSRSSTHGSTARVHGRGRYNSLPSTVICRLAYSPATSVSCLALGFNLDRHSIRRYRTFAASCYVAAQAMLADSLLQYCREFPPLWVGRSRKWDETSQALTLIKSINISKSTWQGMVQKVKVSIAWSDRCSAVYEFVVPPIPLLNSDAPSMHNGIQHIHPDSITPHCRPDSIAHLVLYYYYM